ncbi:MAG: hypothetical protein IKG22_10560 [Atopobiaceae bacterium]|nr:hypothetical protein [Atopobiaceae bacterium]
MHTATKRRTMVVAVLALFAMLTFVPRTALASVCGVNGVFTKEAGELKDGDTITLYMSGKRAADESHSIFVWSNSSDANALTVAKSQNTKIVEIVEDWTSSHNDFFICGVKPGRTTVTFKYLGKKRTINVVVKKYVNALQAIKLGKTSIRGRFKTSSYTKAAKLLKKNRGKKFTVKAKKGWRVCFKAPGYLDLKNGSKIPKDATTITVVLQNTKDKGAIEYTVSMDRKYSM